MREVARGEIHYLKKSADHKAQISPVSGKNVLVFCALRSAGFSGGVFHLEQTHAQSLFSISNGVFLVLIGSFFRWEEGRCSRTLDHLSSISSRSLLELEMSLR